MNEPMENLELVLRRLYRKMEKMDEDQTPGDRGFKSFVKLFIEELYDYNKQHEA